MHWQIYRQPFVCRRCTGMTTHQSLSSISAKPRTLSYLLSYEFNAALQLIPAIADAVQCLQQDLQFSERRELGVDILNAATPKGFLHGDLTVNNILISEQRLVIIDWNSAKWVPCTLQLWAIDLGPGVVDSRGFPDTGHAAA